MTTQPVDIIAQRVRMNGRTGSAGVIAERIIEDLEEAGYRIVPDDDPTPAPVVCNDALIDRECRD